MLVLNSDPMTCLAGKSGAQLTRCGARTQELIDRLTKSFTPLKPARLISNTTHKRSGRAVMAEAYIVAAARTAGGRKGGRLAGWHPADLAASVLDSLIDRTGADPAQIEDVIMGCVMQAGEQSNNVGRNAVMASKLPENVPATSIDGQCDSSHQALHFAAQAERSGTMDFVIAAGVESMTRVPMVLASQLPAKNGFGYYKSPGIEKK